MDKGWTKIFANLPSGPEARVYISIDKTDANVSLGKHAELMQSTLNEVCFEDEFARQTPRGQSQTSTSVADWSSFSLTTGLGPSSWSGHARSARDPRWTPTKLRQSLERKWPEPPRSVGSRGGMNTTVGILHNLCIVDISSCTRNSAALMSVNPGTAKKR